MIEAIAVDVTVALDDDTGTVVTDVLIAVAVDVDVAVAALPSVVAEVVLEVGDSEFKMSVTCTKKNPSTTGRSFDNREFKVL